MPCSVLFLPITKTCIDHGAAYWECLYPKNRNEHSTFHKWSIQLQLKKSVIDFLLEYLKTVAQIWCRTKSLYRPQPKNKKFNYQLALSWVSFYWRADVIRETFDKYVIHFMVIRG